MLVQYPVSLEATNLQKSKKKSVKGISSPQVNMERTVHVHLLVESFYIIFRNSFVDIALGSALFLTCS